MAIRRPGSVIVAVCASAFEETMVAFGSAFCSKPPATRYPTVLIPVCSSELGNVWITKFLTVIDIGGSISTSRWSCLTRIGRTQ